MDPALAWIDTQQDVMADRLGDWCVISSWTFDQAGVEAVGRAVEPVLCGLADTVERVELPAWERMGDDGMLTTMSLCPAWVARKRADALIQVLLNIHLDTVYKPDSGFDHAQRSGDRWIGPGVADAKGGLVVLLTALEALERSDAAKAGRLGWTVLLNGDEEVGSPGSGRLLMKEANRHHVGLVYEPALPNGSLVAARKGSGNYSVLFQGKAAHSGRDFFEGVNAVQHAAALATWLASKIDQAKGVTVNIAKIAGGSADNIVPDSAVLRFNVRLNDSAQRAKFEQDLYEAIGAMRIAEMRLSVETHGSFNNPPKLMTPAIQTLLKQLQQLACDAGYTLDAVDSGGVCDGNKLASVGLPVIDTLGPVGGQLHVPGNEYAIADSLTQRAKLSAALLLGYARGTMTPPGFSAG